MGQETRRRGGAFLTMEAIQTEMFGTDEWHRPVEDPDYREEMTAAERFVAFHLRNPHVYRGLHRLAMSWRRAGHRRWSIYSAFEVLRWQSGTTGGEPWKLNNNFRPYYARLMMECEPGLDGFFETRAADGDDREWLRAAAPRRAEA